MMPHHLNYCVYFRILMNRPSWDDETIKRIMQDISLDMVLEFGARLLLQNLNVACLVDGITNTKMVMHFFNGTSYIKQKV